MIKKEKISGIYKIINKINDKYYVGSSCNANHKRKWGHFYMLRKGVDKVINREMHSIKNWILF